MGVSAAADQRSAVGGGAAGRASGPAVSGKDDRAGADHNGALRAFDAAGISGAWGTGEVQRIEAGAVQWRGAGIWVAGALPGGAAGSGVAQPVWTGRGGHRCDLVGVPQRSA